ncbi:hypothetical protein JCM11641_007134 [Rhodosporidiobolus odoratus]
MATVRTKTKAAATTKSSARTRESAPTVPEHNDTVDQPPPARRRRPSPSPVSSDSSDFEAVARKEARQDSAATQAKEATTQRKKMLKDLRVRGEVIPPELKKAPPKPPGLKAAGKQKGKMKDDEAAVIANAKAAQVGKTGMKRKRESDDDGDERPTYPTLNLGAKKLEVEKRMGMRLKTAYLRGTITAEHASAMSDDEEQVRKHLSRRWVNKKHPDRMSAQRKALELKYNPLVTLLNIELTVVEAVDAAGSDSEAERRNADRAVANHTDSEASSLDDESDDTDWGSDGMGAFNGTIKTPPNRLLRKLEATPSPEAFTDEDEDEPRSTTPFGSPTKPVPVKMESPVDTKPIILDDDDEEEPETDDDDEGDGAATISRASTAIPFAVKKEDITANTKMEDASDEDSEAEPETEPEDDGYQVSDTAPLTLPHFSSHSHLAAPASSPTTGYSQLSSSVKGESQSQLSQHHSQSRSRPQRQSQSQSQVKMKAKAVAVKLEPMDVDEAEDDEPLVVCDISAVSRRITEDEEEARRRKKREEMLKQIAEDSKRREDTARAEAKAAETVAEGALEGESEPEEEVPAWQAPSKKLLQVHSVYPKPVKKGRPKFLLQDAKQASTGPHHLSRDPSDEAQIPAPVNRFLRPYQREGAEFLYGQYKKGMGGILGDDMGLGKTIQVIAFLSAVMDKTGLKKYDEDKRKDAINARKRGDIVAPSEMGQTCLIVCPASVVHNWEREFQTWGYFDIAIYAGSGKEKKACLERFDRGYVDVVIGSVESIRNGIEELSRRDFSIVVCDEAHKLKNPSSETTKAMHLFPTKLRYGLTGTAVQNRLSEFWCVLNWVVPGRVGTHGQWHDLLDRPLKYAQKVDATDEQLVTGRSRAQALVTNLLPNFWLRRTKDSVKLQLPKKTDNVVLCPLTELQKEVYRRLISLKDVEVMLTADDPCPCGERDEDGLRYKRGSCCEQNWTKLIFKYITLLQKVSNHLGLIYPDKEEKEKSPEKYNQDLEWARAAFPDDWQKRRPGVTAFLDPQLCGKWKILCELLEHWHKNGDKVLIFSMSLKVIDLLKDLMETTHYTYLSLDGSTPQDERMPLVDEFNDENSDVFAFLISTRAGGVGLNLTSANRVVIFDPNWNPAHDLQAMDRAYRFGQRREVNVYRLIGAGTLEELIYNRQQYKRAIASTAYDANAERRFYSGVEGEGKDEQGDLWGVRNLFKFSENISLTEKSIQLANLRELEYAMQNTQMFETEDGKVADLPEVDEDEVVAEITGYSKKGKTAQNLSLEELEAQKRHLAEQEAIARILGGTLKMESDATLGGSSIETMRAKGAVKAQQKKPTAASTSSYPAKQKVSKTVPAPMKKVKLETSSTTTDAAYDPLARGSSKRSHSATSPRKTPGPPSSAPATTAQSTIFANYDVPPGTSTEEILAASGYSGSSGLAKFRAELEAYQAGREKAKLIEKVVKKWREVEGLRMKE